MTRIEIINQAYASIGLAGYVFDLTADEVAMAGQSLDAMMAAWSAKGIRLGYTKGGADDETGVPDWAIEAMYLNLGLRIAGSVGKGVMPETKVAAREALRTVMAQTTEIPEMRRDVMATPAGAGNKPYGYVNSPFLWNEPAPIAAGPDGYLET